MSQKVSSIIRNNLGFILFLALMFVFRSSIADWNIVPTGSMKPTIVEGDRIWVNKLAYDLHFPFTTIDLLEMNDPQRGDIIVFKSPEDGIRLVKRVIGIPGDAISIIDKRVFINNKAVEYELLPYVPEGEPIGVALAREQLPNVPHRVQWYGTLGGRFGPVTVGAGEFFVLGDNRDNSQDSRFIGMIPRSLILGRARSVVLSHDYNNYYLPRPGRYFQPLDSDENLDEDNN